MEQLFHFSEKGDEKKTEAYALISRRKFLTACGLGLGASLAFAGFKTLTGGAAFVPGSRALLGGKTSAPGRPVLAATDAGIASGPETGAETSPPEVVAEDAALRDYLYKMRHFDAPHPGDIYLTAAQAPLFVSVRAKLEALQKHVGHLNFQVLSLDEGRVQARRMAGGDGGFTPEELAFMEELFYADAGNYGFLDQKPFNSLAYAIPPREVTKVAGMGNYIYRGAAEARWQEIHKLLGDEVVLTSGVRGVLKQFLLFLNKAERNNGNLSLASRSLAPPGYSYHGVGDFDVGQRGLAEKNFTGAFTETPVFAALSELGYIALRYPQDNLLGVRFEPWHIRVVEQPV